MAKGPGLHQGMYMAGAGKGPDPRRQEQWMNISPPIANTLDEAVSNAKRGSQDGLSQEILDEINTYLSGDQTNSQIAFSMNRRGYSIKARDVAFARTILD